MDNNTSILFDYVKLINKANVNNNDIFLPIEQPWPYTRDVSDK